MRGLILVENLGITLPEVQPTQQLRASDESFSPISKEKLDKVYFANSLYVFAKTSTRVLVALLHRR